MDAACKSTMDRSRSLAAVLMLGIVPSASLAGTPHVGALQGGGRYDRFIVRFEKDAFERTNVAARQRALDAAAIGSGVRIVQLRRLAIGADVLRTTGKLDRAGALQLMQRIAEMPHVEYVEPDALRKPMMVPNDTNYSSQWNYFDPIGGIKLPVAWDTATGSGVVVAVIDTGITPHTDLAANLVAGYDFISDLPHAVDGNGRDADPNDPGDWAAAGDCGAGAPATDSTWHGTHVAGLVAAVTNNAKGVAGVAFGAKVSPLRALGKCGGFASDIADAVVWASGGSVAGVPANANPAEVIEMPLGSAGACDATTQAAIDSAVAAGTVVVVPAGNGSIAASGFAPANCANVIAVGAMARTGAEASYSNYGSTVDLYASGGNSTDGGILSTSNAGTTTQGAESYAARQGTSQASAQVAGIVALMQSVHVNTPALVETILKNTAHPLQVSCGSTCSADVVDASLAVSAASGPILFVHDVTVTEGDSGWTDTPLIHVYLSQPVASDVTFDVRTANGTAKAGTDYLGRADTGKTIRHGDRGYSAFYVQITGDRVQEPDEYFRVTLTNVVGPTAVKPEAIMTIVDTDPPTISIADAVVSEGNAGTKLMTFTVSLTQAGRKDVHYNYSTADGTATAGSDYVAVPLTSRTIPVGQVTDTFTVTVNGDTVAEPDETFHANLSSVGSAATGDLLAIGTITDDGDAVSSVSIGDVTLTEGDSGTKLATFTVSLTEASPSDVTYDIATSNGSAAAGSDYVAKSLVGETIPAGQTSKTFTVTVNGDTSLESNETFNVDLANVAGANIADGHAGGTILNDDTALSVGDASVVEGNSGTKTETFTVSLSHPSVNPVTFDIRTTNGSAKAGSDYAAKSQLAQTIPAGQTSKTFVVNIIGDTTPEANEAFVVNASNVIGASVADSQGTGTIVNDDGATLSIGDVAITEGDAGTKVATFTVALSEAAVSAVTYDIRTANGAAKAGSDYVAKNQTGQTIAAGQTSRTFTVTIFGDTTVETNELFYADLTNVAGATVVDPHAEGRIVNDDGPALSIGDVSTAEGDTGTHLATFTVSLSQASASDVSYSIATADGTAIAGSDYVSRSLAGETIAAGLTSKTFTVTIDGDEAPEPDDTFQVNLGSAVGASIADGQATGTITNDD